VLSSRDPEALCANGPALLELVPGCRISPLRDGVILSAGVFRGHSEVQMKNATLIIRRFRVHARHVDSHHARVVNEATHEAAAVAYIETLGVTTGEELEVSVIVRDLESGHEHCFRVDLETGETTACS
jgi:hypothetical protein